LIEKVEGFINDSKYVPATSYYRSKVLLALTSKALTTARAVCLLVDAGFVGDAMGLSRTLAEIYFTVRYISNKETEVRAALYAEYMAKTQQHLLRVAARYLPDKPLPELREEFARLAGNYTTHHGWANLQIKEMALEEDTYEFDDNGRGLVATFDYDVFYWRTSLYAHASIESLIGHGTGQGEPFRIRADARAESQVTYTVLFNVLAMILKTFICALRGLQEDDQPAELINEIMQAISGYATLTAPA
jgi:Family of unknown function (DUF5677)